MLEDFRANVLKLVGKAFVRSNHKKFSPGTLIHVSQQKNQYKPHL